MSKSTSVALFKRVPSGQSLLLSTVDTGILWSGSVLKMNAPARSSSVNSTPCNVSEAYPISPTLNISVAVRLIVTYSWYIYCFWLCMQVLISPRHRLIVEVDGSSPARTSPSKTRSIFRSTRYGPRDSPAYSLSPTDASTRSHPRKHFDGEDHGRRRRKTYAIRIHLKHRYR